MSKEEDFNGRPNNPCLRMPLPQQQPVAAPARAVVGHKRALLVCVFVAAMTGRLYFETQYRQQIMQQQQRPQSYTADEDDTMLLHTATPRPEDSATPTTSAAAAGDATGDIGGVTTRNDDRQPARMKPSTSTSTTKTKQLKKKKKFFALHIGPSKTGTSTIVSDLVRLRFRTRLIRGCVPSFCCFNFTCFTFFFMYL